MADDRQEEQNPGNAEDKIIDKLVGDIVSDDLTEKDIEDISFFTNHIKKTYYKTPPVDIITFLKDDYYLGRVTKNLKTIFPGWLGPMREIFEDDTKYLIVLTGGIGIGKTQVICGYCMPYILYKIQCMTDPWELYNITQHGKMEVAFFNLTRALDKSKGFGHFQNALISSPYFRERGVIRGEVNQRMDLPEFEWVLASPYCFTGDTCISLLDGREVEIRNIEEELKKDCVYVYSYDIISKKIVPGRVSWAGKTFKKAHVLRLTLDNGEAIKCTDEHLFLTRDGTYEKAKDLRVGSSLMPLYRRLGKGDYEQFYEPATGVWLYTHRRCAGPIPREYRDARGRFVKSIITHHKNFNKRDNRPTNLAYMTGKEHNILHRANLVGSLHSASSRAKAKATLAKVFKTAAYRKKVSAGVRNSGRWTSEKRAKHSKLVSSRMVQRQAKHMCMKADNPKAREQLKRALRNYWDSPAGQSMRKIRKQQSEARRDSLGRFGNHRIVKIEDCGFEDVYDITVDQYDNFALSAGVFVHNSKGFGLLGGAIIAGVMDEVDSPNESEGQKKRILQAYSAAERRFETRFVRDSTSVGRLFLAASKQEELSFLEVYIAEMRNSGKMRVYDKKKYDLVASNFSTERFYVSAGDQFHEPKILASEKERVEALKAGFMVESVPEELRFDFERDIIGALRDHAGVAVKGIRMHKFIPAEHFIGACLDPEKPDPLVKETIEVGQQDDIGLINYMDMSLIRTDLRTPRCVHIDIAYTEDSLGLACSGVADWVDLDIEKEDGTFKRQKMPIVETDFIFRLKAKPNDRIPLFAVRKLLLDLKARGLNIQMVTLDLPIASEDTRQLLEKAGIPTDYLSVDKDMKPYLEWRTLLYEQRWVCHLHGWLKFELKYLEFDRVKNKVNHPEKVKELEVLRDGTSRDIVIRGSKDVADAVVGSVYKVITLGKHPADVEGHIQALKKLGQKKGPAGLPEDWFISDKSKKELGGGVVLGTGNLSEDNAAKMRDALRKLRQGSRRGRPGQGIF